MSEEIDKEIEERLEPEALPEPAVSQEPEELVERQASEEQPELDESLESEEMLEPEERFEPEDSLEPEEHFESEAKSNSEEKAESEIQLPHNRHPERDIPVKDHRLLAGRLPVYDWMGDVPRTTTISDVVEVRFKNTRKGFFTNPDRVPLAVGDVVAVEAALGHDIGVVSLTGELVKEQMRLKRVDTEKFPLKKIYRKAKPYDIEKWQQAIALEHDTMIRSRKIAADLHLNMKIGDVEYQGDRTKAIFYYIADERVDFRTLIKVLADTFHIRVEMKQIGARQEAGRIGGIGPCGRPLCCSRFITNFVSVSTMAARYQNVSLNPQKLAGQCGKLKCCLNYEADVYIDAQKDFPSTAVPLKVGDGMLYHQETNIFERKMYFTPDKEGRGVRVELPVERVKEILEMNRRGDIPERAVDSDYGHKERGMSYSDGVGEDSLSRFDEKRSGKKKRGRGDDKGARQNRKQGRGGNGGNGGGAGGNGAGGNGRGNGSSANSGASREAGGSNNGNNANATGYNNANNAGGLSANNGGSNGSNNNVNSAGGSNANPATKSSEA